MLQSLQNSILFAIRIKQVSSLNASVFPLRKAMLYHVTFFPRNHDQRHAVQHGSANLHTMVNATNKHYPCRNYAVESRLTRIPSRRHLKPEALSLLIYVLEYHRLIVG
jgi:hypothetical protein